MANRRFEMHQYQQVIARLRQGESIRAISKAKIMGRHKATQVQAEAKRQGWLNPNCPLPDLETLHEVFGNHAVRPAAGSCVEPFRDKVLEWARQGVATTVIHVTLQRDYGFQGSYISVRRFIRSLDLTPPKATMILNFQPGEAVQVDFGTGPTLIDPDNGTPRKTWFFVMTLAFSRHIYVECVHNQKVMTWLGCHKRAFEFFGGVPRKVIIDNLTSGIIKACYYDPKAQRSYEELAMSYGFRIAPCPVADPKKKGRVESNVKYVKQNFMPLREFRDLADVNRQLRAWVLETAGNRIHGTTRRRPLEMFAEVESKALQPMPDHPVELAVWGQGKVHGDCHVQYEKCRYSVPFKYIHQTVWIKSTEKMIYIYDAHELLASHPKGKIPGQVRTITEHYPPEGQAYVMKDPQWCLEQAEKVGPYCKKVIETLFLDRVMEKLRAAYGIVNLKKKYGAARLEKACIRALHYNIVTYRSVKDILGNGSDQLPLEVEGLLPLEEVYTASGKYIRQSGDTRLTQ